MTADILSAVDNAQSSHQQAVLAGLRSNRVLLLDQLQTDSSFQEVRRLRDEVMTAAEWFSGDTEDTAWGFVQECLLLLLTLARHLSIELEVFRQSRAPSAAKLHTPEMAPPLPPDILSVTQQRTLRVALQSVVSLGLCPYLAPGVGVPLGRRSAFGAMVEKLVRGGAVSAGRCRLLITTNVLLQLTELSSLATLVFTQHLGDVMAALCQLGYQPHRAERGGSEEEEERRSCREALRGLLGKVYQPIIIKELLILQGGSKQSFSFSYAGALGSAPAWLRRLCGQLLSERLMQPSGVQAVVRAILEGGTGGESDWRKCDAVARILVACPQQSASADSYYRQVCPQILDLLHFRDKLTAQQFQRVATRAVLSMVQEKPSFAHQYLLTPLLAPLRCYHTAVEEWELTQWFGVILTVTLMFSVNTVCVPGCCQVWVVGNSPSAPLLKALEEVLPVIFTLFCCQMFSLFEDTLLWYLSHTDTCVGLSVLRQLSGLQGQRIDAADFHFSPGSDGGARFISKESSSDDDALYEKLSEEQWRLECLMQLLVELKDSDLPGDFFLDLLRELTSWAAAADEVKTEEEELDVSTMTLLEVEQQLLGGAERQGQRLVLLQVLAVMVESLQHTVLLRKNTQVVDFIVSLIQRACVGLDQVTDPGLVNPVESQTLSMAMGLVATLLSGPQLGAEDYSSMSRLLPPLETLSQRHSDVVIQELASNLRTVIATHGAYWPENLTAAAHNTRVRHQVSSVPAAARMTAQGGERNHGKTALCSSTKPLSDWLLKACDPDVPTRAFALRVLTQMMQDQNPEAVQAQDKVLTLFLENLEHEDSFIYLSAIQGLAALADSYPERILGRLLQDFQHGPSLPTSNKEHSLETRLKVGEVLMRASRAMGELAPHLGRSLVGVFLSLSNLGELCQKLDYSLGPLAQEVRGSTHCAKSTAQTGYRSYLSKIMKLNRFQSVSLVSLTSFHVNVIIHRMMWKPLKSATE
uniref:Transport and golgi organization 6 homolog (Drosophila) n=1 Tax=Lates calcarifer TaxID=8187 RepID=A0A4W6C1I8_LATCA